jgi:hypothetical protein
LRLAVGRRVARLVGPLASEIGNNLPVGEERLDQLRSASRPREGAQFRRVDSDGADAFRAETFPISADLIPSYSDLIPSYVEFLFARSYENLPYKPLNLLACRRGESKDSQYFPTELGNLNGFCGRK